MTAPEHFEDRLLHELRHVVADRPAPAGTPARRPRRLRLSLAGAGLGIAAAATVAVVMATGDGVSKAYAVEAQPNGSVTVAIHSLSDAAGLQAKLRAAGVPAVVDYVPGDQGVCLAPDGAAGGVQQSGGGGQAAGAAVKTGGPTETGPSFSTGGASAAGGPTLSPGPDPAGAPIEAMTRVSVGQDGATFTIDPGTLEPGQQVFISTSTGAVTSISMMIGTSKGPVPCPPAP